MASCVARLWSALTAHRAHRSYPQDSAFWFGARYTTHCAPDRIGTMPRSRIPASHRSRTAESGKVSIPTTIPLRRAWPQSLTPPRGAAPQPTNPLAPIRSATDAALRNGNEDAKEPGDNDDTAPEAVGDGDPDPEPEETHPVRTARRAATKITAAATTWYRGKRESRISESYRRMSPLRIARNRRRETIPGHRPETGRIRLLLCGVRGWGNARLVAPDKNLGYPHRQGNNTPLTKASLVLSVSFIRRYEYQKIGRRIVVADHERRRKPGFPETHRFRYLGYDQNGNSPFPGSVPDMIRDIFAQLLRPRSGRVGIGTPYKEGGTGYRPTGRGTGTRRVPTGYRYL
jgi:hypothetical protein